MVQAAKDLRKVMCPGEFLHSVAACDHAQRHGVIGGENGPIRVKMGARVGTSSGSSTPRSRPPAGPPRGERCSLVQRPSQRVACARPGWPAARHFASKDEHPASSARPKRSAAFSWLQGVHEFIHLSAAAAEREQRQKILPLANRRGPALVRPHRSIRCTSLGAVELPQDLRAP